MLQNEGVFYILTCQCAWRHSGVPFFDIRTSKIGPRTGPHVFNILTCKCASRYSGVQIFHRARSKKALKLRCFVHFYLQMRFASQRRAIFRHRNFQKCSDAAVFCTFDLKFASRHSGVPFFLSALSSYLRTRRFSEPTFRPSQHTNPRKNAAFRDFPSISRVWIFFLLTFAQLYLLSSDSTSLLCFSSSDSASLLCFFQLSILSEVRLLNFL